MKKMLRMCADAAADTEDHLDKEGWLRQRAFGEVCERIQVTDVIALELEARAMSLAEAPKNAFDVAKGIAEDDVVAAPNVVLLPIKIPLSILVGHLGEDEVHRTQVQ